VIVPLPPVCTGARMREVRKLYGISCVEAARQLGVSSKHLERVERGARPIERTLSLAFVFVSGSWAVAMRRPLP